MKTLEELFAIEYPSTLVFGHYKNTPGSIPFVTSTARNNGVAGYVAPISGARRFPAGSISVPMKGSVLQAHVQTTDFYCAHQIAVLTPRKEMTESQKLFYVCCIRENAMKFNYGRQADRTLRSLRVPAIEDLPDFIGTVDPTMFDGASAAAVPAEKVTNPWPTYTELVPLRARFDVRHGNDLEFYRLKVTTSELGVPFVSRKAGDNGVAGYVVKLPEHAPNPAGEMTVALSGQGGRLSTFIQDRPYYTGFHVARLIPKEPMSTEVKLYYCACIYANRFRFGFGRQANRTLGDIRVPAPKGQRGQKMIEVYIKSLPFSSGV